MSASSVTIQLVTTLQLRNALTANTKRLFPRADCEFAIHGSNLCVYVTKVFKNVFVFLEDPAIFGGAAFASENLHADGTRATDVPMPLTGDGQCAASPNMSMLPFDQSSTLNPAPVLHSFKHT